MEQSNSIIVKILNYNRTNTAAIKNEIKSISGDVIASHVVEKNWNIKN